MLLFHQEGLVDKYSAVWPRTKLTLKLRKAWLKIGYADSSEKKQVKYTTNCHCRHLTSYFYPQITLNVKEISACVPWKFKEEVLSSSLKSIFVQVKLQHLQNLQDVPNCLVVAPSRLSQEFLWSISSFYRPMLRVALALLSAPCALRLLWA